MKRLFNELMQISVGQLDCLSRGPSPEEWQGMYELARREGVTGVCYRSVVALFEFGLRAPQDLSIDWMAEAEEIRERGETIRRRTLSLQQKLSENGIRSSVLMGLGTSGYYGEELKNLRESASIDIYVGSNKERALRFVKRAGLENPKVDNQEVFFEKWADTPVRLHFAIKAGKTSWRNKKLEKWVSQNDELLYRRDGEMTIPSPSMNAVLQTVNLYNRFLTHHLSMRDLMDYFLLLRQIAGRPIDYQGGLKTYVDVIKALRLSRFSAGLMWLMQEVMGMKRKFLLCEPSEQEGRFLLDDIMHEYKFLNRWTHLLTYYCWRDIL